MAFTIERNPHETPKAPPEVGFLVSETFRPVDELPELDLDTHRDQEFWPRRILRPGEPGPNTNNIPFFQFGVNLGETQARLRVPSLPWLNGIARVYAPNGYQLRPVDGFVDAYHFLDMVANREFPVASRERVGRIRNNIPGRLVIDQINGLSSNAMDDAATEVITIREHDLIQHSGILTMPGVEADKLSSFIGKALSKISIWHPKKLAELTAVTDKLLEDYSLYAYCEAFSIEPNDLAFRMYYRHRMNSYQKTLNEKFAGYAGRELKLNINRLDTSIKQFQRIPIAED